MLLGTPGSALLTSSCGRLEFAKGGALVLYAAVAGLGGEDPRLVWQSQPLQGSSTGPAAGSAGGGTGAWLLIGRTCARDTPPLVAACLPAWRQLCLLCQTPEKWQSGRVPHLVGACGMAAAPPC
jgi:hypothetical protein